MCYEYDLHFIAPFVQRVERAPYQRNYFHKSFYTKSRSQIQSIAYACTDIHATCCFHQLMETCPLPTIVHCCVEPMHVGTLQTRYSDPSISFGTGSIFLAFFALISLCVSSYPFLNSSGTFFSSLPYSPAILPASFPRSASF